MQVRYLSLFDIDKTLFDTPIFLPLAQFQYEHQIISKECLETLRNDLNLYIKRKISYDEAISNIIEHWGSGLVNVNTQIVLNNSIEFFKKNIQHFYPFVDELFNLLKKTHDIYLVTGEAQFVAEAVCSIFSLKGYLSSKLIVNETTYTGRVDYILAKGIDKERVLSSLLEKYPKNKSFAFGDSESDIEMLSMVAYPICIVPSDTLKDYAEENNWSIVTETGVLETVSKLIYT